eukprot:4322130-Lingulodinium_polyedra.AAC.1
MALFFLRRCNRNALKLPLNASSLCMPHLSKQEPNIEVSCLHRLRAASSEDVGARINPER